MAKPPKEPAEQAAPAAAPAEQATFIRPEVAKAAQASILEAQLNAPTHSDPASAGIARQQARATGAVSANTRHAEFLESLGNELHERLVHATYESPLIDVKVKDASEEKAKWDQEDASGVMSEEAKRKQAQKDLQDATSFASKFGKEGEVDADALNNLDRADELEKAKLKAESGPRVSMYGTDVGGAPYASENSDNIERVPRLRGISGKNVEGVTIPEANQVTRKERLVYAMGHLNKFYSALEAHKKAHAAGEHVDAMEHITRAADHLHDALQATAGSREGDDSHTLDEKGEVKAPIGYGLGSTGGDVGLVRRGGGTRSTLGMLSDKWAPSMVRGEAGAPWKTKESGALSLEGTPWKLKTTVIAYRKHVAEELGGPHNLPEEARLAQRALQPVTYTHGSKSPFANDVESSVTEAVAGVKGVIQPTVLPWSSYENTVAPLPKRTAPRTLPTSDEAYQSGEEIRTHFYGFRDIKADEFAKSQAKAAAAAKEAAELKATIAKGREKLGTAEPEPTEEAPKEVNTRAVENSAALIRLRPANTRSGGRRGNLEQGMSSGK